MTRYEVNVQNTPRQNTHTQICVIRDNNKLYG